MNSMLFITSGYPTVGKPIYTFVETLVNGVADQAIETTVIYPVSITHFLLYREQLPPKFELRKTINGSQVSVYCPRIITFSSSSNAIISAFLARVNLYSFKRAVYRTIKKKKPRFDSVYGHFIFPSGFVARDVGLMYNKPSCLGYGENTSYTVDEFGILKTREMLKGLSAVISVSSDNTKYLVDNRIVPADIIQTIPNAVNRDVFKPYDRVEMRKVFGFPQNAFIVSYVGFFSDIKGSLRVAAAIDSLSQDVNSIFIGSSQNRTNEFEPKCRGILFRGKLKHEDIPKMLSASDVFVLPTVAEGCCNAIIEAMACGLPIISSDLPFNDDILDNECAIRIDATDIKAIANAILRLKNDIDLRRKMSEASLKKAKGLDIQSRAKRVLHWIDFSESKNSCTVKGG